MNSLIKIKNFFLQPVTKVFSFIELRDCFIFGGTALIACGAYQIYKPAAYIVSGLIFFWLGIRKVN